MADQPLQPSLPISLDPPVPEPLQDAAFAALFGRGKIGRDSAIRLIGDHYGQLGLLEPVKQLRKNSALYRHIATVVRALVRAGRVDEPEPDTVRAIRPQAQDYSAEDWYLALNAVLSSDLTLRDTAIRAAADWAAENLGLTFRRLSTRGRVYQGIHAAVEQGVRAGDIKIVAEDYIRKCL